MFLQIELPVDCDLFINSYDLDDLAKVVRPLKILSCLTDNESGELLRVDFRVRQTTTKNKD